MEQQGEIIRLPRRLKIEQFKKNVQKFEKIL